MEKAGAGAKLKKLIKECGFNRTSELTDSILLFITSNTPKKNKSSLDIKANKSRLQSEFSKIFSDKKTPGLEIILQLIEVLSQKNCIYSPVIIGQKIIEIYQDNLNIRHTSFILHNYNKKNKDINTLSFLSKMDQEWFKKYYYLTQDSGGLDWDDSHRKHPELDKSIKEIFKLLSECIKNDDFENFKIIYQNIANFLQLYGYRTERVYLSQELDSLARKRRDKETSIQARASHTWSLVTDRNLELAKNILSELLEDFKNLNKYDQKTNFAKIISFENLARIAIIEERFDLAQRWFEKQLEEIEVSKDLGVCSRYRIRYTIPLDYHAGRIDLYRNDYHSALQHFEKAQKDAEKIDWVRMQACSQNWIAKIYLVQENLTIAESLLKNGLDIALKINSKGRLGFYHQDLAILYKKKDEKEGIFLKKEYEYHYFQACSIFNQLGMDNAIENLKRIVE